MLTNSDLLTLRYSLHGFPHAIINAGNLDVSTLQYSLQGFPIWTITEGSPPSNNILKITNISWSSISKVGAVSVSALSKIGGVPK